ncbi:MAG: hypothetical protein LBS68_01450 [Puniceicoccales bacterium]|jgi:hypothetical protein|nr:hypothetical protein [Puniceicoccales bacterium]
MSMGGVGSSSSVQHGSPEINAGASLEGKKSVFTERDTGSEEPGEPAAPSPDAAAPDAAAPDAAAADIPAPESKEAAEGSANLVEVGELKGTISSASGVPQEVAELIDKGLAVYKP